MVQSFKDYSVKIYDDCSTDDSFEIGNEFCRNDERFEIIQNDSRAGLVSNFRISLNDSNSEFFMWMGAHDLMESNYLLELITMLEHNKGLAAAFPKVKHLKANGEISVDDSHKDWSKSLSPTKNYLQSIGAGRSRSTHLHGVYRREFIKDFGNFKWNTAAFDLVLLTRAEYFGTAYNSNTSYVRRSLDESKILTHKGSGASYRYFAKSDKQYGLKRLTYIPLYQMYINDFFRLPITLRQKMSKLPALVFFVTQRFEINLVSNLLIYFWNSVSFNLRKSLRI
jgi:glycosyltransferase involved in cell wall biosynthesis